MKQMTCEHCDEPICDSYVVVIRNSGECPMCIECAQDCWIIVPDDGLAELFFDALDIALN